MKKKYKKNNRTKLSILFHNSFRKTATNDMVSIFRISILFLVTISIQDSLQNEIDKSININKDASTSKLVKQSGLENNKSFDDVSIQKDEVSMNVKRIYKPLVVGGGNEIKCITRREQRIRRLYFMDRFFYTPYYVTVRHCNKF